MMMMMMIMMIMMMMMVVVVVVVVVIMSYHKVPIKLVARKLLAIVSRYDNQVAGSEMCENVVMQLTE
jgi:hypothetical protein